MATLHSVITGELKSRIDRVWDAFWSGGISNPMEVIEQITYLLFIRRLDELQTLAERKARVTGQLVNPQFGPEQRDLRWSEFKGRDPETMFEVVADEVFPFLRTLGGEGSTYSSHMRDARFTIPTPQLLDRVVGLLNDIPMDDRDTNGDLYEYVLSKIASAGVNGQFRTPRHIIKLMVDLMAPTPADEICDPACGTAGFLVAASEYVREQHPSALTNETQRKHFHNSMFHGYDFDSTMLRIGSMNMMMHGIEAPDIRYRDSLSEGASGEVGRYTLILANPPFAGSLDYESTTKDLQRTQGNAVLMTIGDALIFAGRPEPINRPERERFVTVKLNGGGAVERVIRDGKTPVPFTGYRVLAGQFIYSRIDARNGAFAIVPPSLDGAVASKDFPSSISSSTG